MSLSYHSLILKKDGTVWGCGYNNKGQLDNGTTTNSSTLVQTTNATDVKAIACGTEHTIILKNDGTVWACGNNTYGQLGNGDTTSRGTLVQMTNATDVKAIACGQYYTVILKNDSTVWGCGRNNYGQLGNNTTDDKQTSLVQIQGATDVKAIACGTDHTIILKNDGTVWGCGRNINGQLGNGTNTTSSTLVQMTNATDIKDIACGTNYSLILKNDSTVWGCGRNGNGQLGNGTTTDSYTLVQMTNATDVKAIACGGNHILILKYDGTVWACGNNTYGQLGNGDTTSRGTLVQMTNATDVKAIACGYYHSLILKNDSTVWGCGRNNNGQLGDGTTTDSSTLVQMTNATDVKQLMNLPVPDIVFLINANNKYYTTDGTTLTEVTTLNTIESEGFTDITLVNDYLEANPTAEFTSYKIISNIEVALHARYYKASYMMMLNKSVTRQDVTTIQNNFITYNSDKFDVFYIFSLDDGTTWKTVDDSNTIIDFPTFTTPTSNTTTEWETLKELVLENGISYSNTSFSVLDDIVDELNFRIIIVLKMKDYIKESETNTNGLSKITLNTTAINNN